MALLIQPCMSPLLGMIQLGPAVWLRSGRDFEHNSPGLAKPTTSVGEGKAGWDSVLPCHCPLCSERSWRRWIWCLVGCSHPPGCHHPLLHPCRKKRAKKQGWGWGEPLWVSSTQGFPSWVGKVAAEQPKQGLSSIIRLMGVAYVISMKAHPSKHMMAAGLSTARCRPCVPFQPILQMGH